MGQQQLLLIIIGTIIVGIAIAISLSLFRANAIASKRDMLITECNYLAAKAIDYYKKPKQLDGGNRTFTNWEIPAKLVTTENGNFLAVTSADNVIITGTGNEVITGSDSIKVQVIVYPLTTVVTIIN